MQLTSDSLRERGRIPADRSPQLGWSEVPAGTESLALLCMDADYGTVGYHGPVLPPNETHHYIFRIYALDVAQLDLPERFTGHELLNAIYGHIIDEAQLIGAYTQP